MIDVLVLFPATEDMRLQLARDFGSRCRFTFRDPDWSREEYLRALGNAQVIFGEPKNEDFVHCSSMKWMQSPSSGVNYYVQGGAFPANATLTCTTGGYGRVIAEHLVALTMSLCRRLPEYHCQQQDHRWKWIFHDKQMEDCTLLILGAGDIGTTAARFLRPMVKTVIGMRRTNRPLPDCFDAAITPDQLDETLPLADIVLCALPHTPETIGLLSEARLRSMKKDAVLVNGGRGSLIDQDALCRLLQEGHFWGVGLEVTAPEPLPPEHPLWDQPRLIITPHVSGNTYSLSSPLYRRIWTLFLENLSRYLAGDPLHSIVDFSTGYRRSSH